jgi:hypothetical protein
VSEADREARRRDDEDEPLGLGSIPGLAQIAATAWWHTAGWTVGTSARAGRRLLGVMVRPDKAPELAADMREAARTAARDLVGMADLEERLRNAAPDNPVVQRMADAVPKAEPVDERVAKPPSQRARERAQAANGEAAASLPDRGRDLLRLSSDVRYEEQAHPAYERILGDLAPDEGRVLRLLLLEGPQPAVDVRTGGPLGLVNSRLIAPGLNMIGPRAGCRYVDRIPAYLNNLNRLGLVWFSRETLRDAHRYQVLEAQPDVLEATHSVRQAKLVRRSIHLTPFGEDFCRVCLSLGSTDLSALPTHSDPEAKDVVSGPAAG